MQIKIYIDKATVAERERCAKLVEDFNYDHSLWNDYKLQDDIAAAIRKEPEVE